MDDFSVKLLLYFFGFFGLDMRRHDCGFSYYELLSLQGN